ncbi:hypothetical protein KSP40_PGU010467 [Platanthera guangdongensis]|uniref:Uncharacterized protein n=1 Tax=Platanthera guangdongensis TaxID=2320717 RepID=A0ABR2M0A2_9ASPA
MTPTPQRCTRRNALTALPHVGATRPLSSPSSPLLPPRAPSAMTLAFRSLPCLHLCHGIRNREHAQTPVPLSSHSKSYLLLRRLCTINAPPAAQIRDDSLSLPSSGLLDAFHPPPHKSGNVHPPQNPDTPLLHLLLLRNNGSSYRDNPTPQHRDTRLLPHFFTVIPTPAKIITSFSTALPFTAEATIYPRTISGFLRRYTLFSLWRCFGLWRCADRSECEAVGFILGGK